MRSLARGGSWAVACLLASGCASSRLHTARTHFYAGRLEAAEQCLTNAPDGERDAVLYWMERGTVRQNLRKYDESTADWLKAVEQERVLQTRSATQTAASFLVNDKTIAYRGPPFERTLVHAFLAKNFLAQGKWDDAGVEARNIIRYLQDLDGFPDDAYSRYMAGFCLELLNDPSNAALQYRNASNLVQNLLIDERTGSLGRPPGDAGRGRECELVCFVAMGRSPRGSEMWGPFPSGGPAPYAEIHAGGRYLGRSYPLANVGDLLRRSLERQAALQAAKDVSRIVVKEVIAHQVKQKDETLGLLTELLLLAMESPDDRRWETLPMWLEVARVPCPRDLAGFDVVYRGPGREPGRRQAVTSPLVRRGNLFVSFCRELPAAPRPAPALPGRGQTSSPGK